MGVGADQVEVELVSVHFGKEFSTTGEVFEIEELVFFQTVHGFHIALVGVCGGWNAHVLAVAEGFREIAFEFAAIIGLPDQSAQRDTLAIEMLLDAAGEDRAGRSAAILCEGPKEQAAADFASSVLDGWQVQALSLQPVAWNIVEILGIGADLLKQRPASFDVREVLLALIFPATFFQQTLLAPNAFQGIVTDAQIELANETTGAEGGKSFAEFDQLGLDSRWSFVRLAVTSAGQGQQTGRTMLPVAAQPLANGGHGGGEEARGGLDAALLGALDQPQAMVVGVFHLTHQIEITGGSRHGAAIVSAARRPALPPAGRPSPTTSSRSNTSTSPGGYDVTGLFHTPTRV